MRIVFHDASIHECTRVAFVAVTDNVLRERGLTCHLGPLTTGLETAAATATQVTFGDFVDDLVCTHIKECLFECDIAADTQIFFNRVGIDLAAVLQCKALLLLIERDFILLCIYHAVQLISQTLDQFPIFDGLCNDFLTVGNRDLGVKPALRLNADQRSDFAEARATALGDTDFIPVRILLKFNRASNARILHESNEFCIDIQRTAGNTTRTGADQNLLLFCGKRLLAGSS